MAQINQTVSFSKTDIQNLLIEKAKEHIKEQTGKDPTGASSFKLGTMGTDEDGATVNFLCNGKR